MKTNKREISINDIVCDRGLDKGRVIDIRGEDYLVYFGDDTRVYKEYELVRHNSSVPEDIDKAEYVLIYEIFGKETFDCYFSSYEECQLMFDRLAGNSWVTRIALSVNFEKGGK